MLNKIVLDLYAFEISVDERTDKIHYVRIGIFQLGLLAYLLYQFAKILIPIL
jgi:hypothetical protein